MRGGGDESGILFRGWEKKGGFQEGNLKMWEEKKTPPLRILPNPKSHVSQSRIPTPVLS